jgi:DNA-directed RNA polymerase specialized sigma24 family protein
VSAPVYDGAAPPRAVVRGFGVPLQQPPGEAPDAIVERLPIVALLNELPPRRRAVLVLRYCCDLSIEQTARALGCSAGTVKSQSARALATLRDRMSTPEPGRRLDRRRR